MSTSVQVTNKEVTFQPDDIIVSKTDLKGRITYCNDIFLNIAGYTEKEAMGQPHNLIRHLDMPRSVFHLLWQTIGNQREIFAYVKNRTKNGDYYWVLAHVTPSYDVDGMLNGYHSNRRVASRVALSNVIIPLYEELLAIESKPSNRKEGMNTACTHLQKVLADQEIEYAEFIAKLAFAA